MSQGPWEETGICGSSCCLWPWRHWCPAKAEGLWHRAQELKLKKDPEEDAEITGLEAASPQRDEPADKWQHVWMTEWLALHSAISFATHVNWKHTAKETPGNDIQPRQADTLQSQHHTQSGNTYDLIKYFSYPSQSTCKSFIFQNFWEIASLNLTSSTLINIYYNEFKSSNSTLTLII